MHVLEQLHLCRIAIILTCNVSIILHRKAMEPGVIGRAGVNKMNRKRERMYSEPLAFSDALN